MLVDLFFITLILFSALTGLKNGLLKALIGPSALVMATIGSILYYSISKNIIMASIFGLFGPFVLHIAFQILWKIFASKESPTLQSRIGAGIVLSIWNYLLWGMVLVTIGLFPEHNALISQTKAYLKTSQTYQTLNKLTNTFIPLESLNSNNIFAISQDPAKLEELQGSLEFKDLMENVKFQNVVEDKTTMRQIQDKDILGLIKNPKVLEIMEDPKLLKQFVDLHKKANSLNSQ